MAVYQKLGVLDQIDDTVGPICSKNLEADGGNLTKTTLPPLGKCAEGPRGERASERAATRHK